MAGRRLSLADGYDAALAAAAAALAAGELAVFPTETVYGIAAVAGHAGALARLRRSKGRDGDKPFQLLVADSAMGVALGGVFSPGARRLAEAVWPGPLTLVVPAIGPDATLGLRVPGNAFARDLIRRLGRALVTSSANRHGEPAPVDAEAADVFGGEVAVVVDGGPVGNGLASTVVAAREDGGYAILREGALPADRVAALWNG